MLKRFIYISLFYFFLPSLSLGQKAYTFSQWHRNMLSINPANAGFNEHLVISALHRSQWIGMPGAPTLQNLEAHWASKGEKHSWGFNFNHESIGAGNYFDFFGVWAYGIKLPDASLKFGLKVGFNNTSRDIIELRDDKIDPSFDPENTSYTLPNFGAGISYYNETYFAGLSIPEFFGSKSSSNGKTQIDHNFANYIYRLSGGYKFNLNNDFEIQPVALIDVSITKGVQVNININGTYRKTFLGGLGFRSGEAIQVHLGYRITNQFSGLYSYDFNIGKVGSYSNGSHEIGFIYHFGYQVVVSDPRDF